jgi:hypothetical protein
MSASVALYTASPVKALTLYGTGLYVGKPLLSLADDSQYIFGRIGDGTVLPVDASTSTPSFLPWAASSANLQICQANFQSPTIIWGAACGQVYGGIFYSGGIIRYTFNTSSHWFISQFAVPAETTGIRSLVGNTVAGVYQLYIIGEPARDGSSTQSTL